MTAPCDWICLSLLPGLGPGGLKKLLEKFGSAKAVLQARPEQLRTVAGLRASQLAGFDHVEEHRRQALRQFENARSLGADVVCMADSRYPEMLRQLPDPPPVLYAMGDIHLLLNDLVAVVGSRAATRYGRRVAYSFSRQLSDNAVTVVSGLALGIDSEAHAGALEGGASTVAVLGCGLDVVYPSQNRALHERIRRHGLLLTEYPLGTRPEGFRFPARNRIIAGLSRGVVVVEAARKSGSLITAQMALDFGREIFAVPGQVDSYKSAGTHWLLQQGARLAASAEDILEELHFCSTSAPMGEKSPQRHPPSGLDPDAAALLELLEPYPEPRDEIIRKTGLLPSRVSELLLFLELEGCIELLPGDLVRRLN